MGGSALTSEALGWGRVVAPGLSMEKILSPAHVSGWCRQLPAHPPPRPGLLELEVTPPAARGGTAADR